MNVLLVILLSSFFFPPAALSTQQKIVTAAQVNGTWESKLGTFRIWALGEGKLKVEFSGIYPYRWADGTRLANTGEGRGTAMIEGRRAIFRPEAAEDGCEITMDFVGGGLAVRQEGTCGFGHNVTAAGKYRRTSARRPKFEQD
jgi:hypothetical protein